MWRMTDIKESMQLLKCGIITYENCVYTDEELLRQCLMKKLVRDGLILIRNSKEWIDAHRNGYLGAEIYMKYLEIQDNKFFGNYGEENLNLMKDAVYMIERSIFGKE